MGSCFLWSPQRAEGDAKFWGVELVVGIAKRIQQVSLQFTCIFLLPESERRSHVAKCGSQTLQIGLRRRLGRHLAFDGRFLHGATAPRTRPCRGQRVTFLVRSVRSVRPGAPSSEHG